MSKLLDGVEDLEGMVTVAGQQFDRVWRHIGISGEARVERQRVVMTHTKDILDNMLLEEIKLAERLESNIVMFTNQVEQLSSELNAAVAESEKPAGLLDQEKLLKGKVAYLVEVKEERMGQLKSLLNKDKVLSTELGVGMFQIEGHRTPSPQQLQQFQQHISNLETEKMKRQKDFCKMRTCIVDLLNELELSPNTSFERSIICEGDLVMMTEDNIYSTKQYHLELEKLLQSNKQELDVMWARLRQLWQKLAVGEDEVAKVEAGNQGLSQRVIFSLADELRVLEDLKLQNMRMFVDETRKELLQIWDTCFVPQETRDLFSAFYEDEMTEQLLRQHEDEVASMRQYYHNNQDMLTLVARQQKLWKEHLELENKANHVSNERYCNRGGQLLKEEKMRKKIKMDLPKVETEVFQLIQEWEARTGREFLVGGCSFKEFVKRQKDDHANEKENEKFMKQQQRARQTEEELMYGSKPATPGKRFANTTPSKTPNKARKIDTPSSSRTLFKRPLHSPMPSSKLKDRTVNSKGHLTDTRSTASTTTSSNKPPLERSGSLQVLTPKKNKINGGSGASGSSSGSSGSGSSGSGSSGGGSSGSSGGSIKKLNSGSNVELRSSGRINTPKKYNTPKNNANANKNNHLNSNNNLNNMGGSCQNLQHLTVLSAPLNPVNDTTITLHNPGHYDDFANGINKVSKNNARSTMAPKFF